MSSPKPPTSPQPDASHLPNEPAADQTAQPSKSSTSSSVGTQTTPRLAPVPPLPPTNSATKDTQTSPVLHSAAPCVFFPNEPQPDAPGAGCSSTSPPPTKRANTSTSSSPNGSAASPTPAAAVAGPSSGAAVAGPSTGAGARRLSTAQPINTCTACDLDDADADDDRSSGPSLPGDSPLRLAAGFMPGVREVRARRRSPSVQRKFPHIPVFIVEAHNDVLEYLYRCLGARYLPFQGCAMLHFDSHPDMCVPRFLDAGLVRERNALLASLSIENWIVPSLFAGHFDRVVWAKPAWSRQIPEGQQQFTVGEFAERIHVSCDLDYFVGEGSYRPAEELRHGRNVLLQTMQVPFRDVWEGSLAEVLSYGVLVLDIDLDYFSTRDPFRDVYPLAEATRRLGVIFEYERPVEDAPQVEVLRCSQGRAEQLDELERVFQELAANGGRLELIQPVSAVVRAVWPQIGELLAALNLHYDAATVDWPQLYNAGCTRDSRNGDLPHHIATAAQLDAGIAEFEQVLRDLQPVTPTVITIARSAEDDYCPVDQVEDIQERVWRTLQRVYGHELSAKPICYYKEDDWSFDRPL